jgi:Protein of unknown function (DUF3300)
MHPLLRSSTAVLLAILFSLTSLTTGCKSSRNASQVASQNQAAKSQPASLSLDDLVAPIALYPDQLLAQVLIASTTPQEVLDGGNWIIQNQSVKGDALISAAKTAGFGPSMQYLMNFPQVIDNMCQEMDWTTQLGQAFQSDQKGVMEAVQRKRAQAQQIGNLVSSPQMTVATKNDNGQQYVEIKPADPKVVYVPQYNPVTIYNTQAAPVPAPAQTTTTSSSGTSSSSGVSTGTAVGIGLLSFGVGMAIGAAINNNNNYYPYPAWGYHGVHYSGHPYYPPPYRPAYPGYHPANGYHPPSNYHWNQVNHNVNVNVNNNYYNQFNNQNRPSTLPTNNRVGNTSVNPVITNGRGQVNGTYQGARPATGNQKPGASMASAVPRNQQLAARGIQPTSMARPNPSTRTAATSNMANNRPYPSNGGSMNRGGDRGYSSASRPSTGAVSAPAAHVSASSQTQNRSRGGAAAFDGGSAQAERAASSRGHSSMGGGRRRR